MYKSESTLGLVASILSSVFAFFILVGSVFGILYFNMFEPVIHQLVDQFAGPWGWTYDTAIPMATPILIVIASVWLVLAVAVLILGFLGTSRLRNDDKSGGVMLIVAGGLSFFSVWAFIPFVLYLVGGIMAVSKKPRPAETPAPQQPTV
jgi:hypothetical protein